MNPTDVIHPSWGPIRYLLNEDSLVELRTNVLPNIISYPQRIDIFRVFSLPVDQIDVVILGQDPYHGPNQATGLAFSVGEGITPPPSLKIIRQEIEQSVEISSPSPSWQTLYHWQRQGIFLFNTALTVESGKPGSHLSYWENFSRKVINFISAKNPCVWMLWGRKAQAFIPYINNPLHVVGYNRDTIEKIPQYKDVNYILSAAHPAAEMYSKNAGFLGTDHFYFVQQIIYKKKHKLLNW